MSALDTFYELHEQIRQAPDYGCAARANRLVKELECTTNDVARYVVRSALFGPDGEREKLRPLPYSRSIAWDEHIICIAAGVVYDPVLTEPTATEDYPEKMFGDHPVVISPKPDTQ